MDPTTFNFGNVRPARLLLGPAERADVIVDFSQYAGKTLILYNDAPAAFPALDPRYDYYTGAPDLTDTGGHSGTAGRLRPQHPHDHADQGGRRHAGSRLRPGRAEGGVHHRPRTHAGRLRARRRTRSSSARRAYNSAYNTTFPTIWPLWGYARIQDTSMTFKTVDGTTLTLPFEPKAIQDEMGEAFDRVRPHERQAGPRAAEHQRAATRTSSCYSFIDPPTEIVKDSMTPLSPVAGDGTQIWKITHNGVDTHPIHFHLFDVQLINRVGWDGAIRLPDANELGWKDTVRVSPLEDTIVALRPIAPEAAVRRARQHPAARTRRCRSARPMGFTNLDPLTGQPLDPPIDEPARQLRLGVRVALPHPQPRRDGHDAADHLPGRHASCRPRPC